MTTQEIYAQHRAEYTSTEKTALRAAQWAANIALLRGEDDIDIQIAKELAELRAVPKKSYAYAIQAKPAAVEATQGRTVRSHAWDIDLEKIGLCFAGFVAFMTLIGPLLYLVKAAISLVVFAAVFFGVIAVVVTLAKKAGA